MKRALMIGGGILAVLLIALFTIPFLIPKSVYRNQIETAATKALGREVTLEGDVSISVFPQIRASVADIRVANPDGFSREDMVTAGALRGSVKWLPLFTGKVEIAEIAFVDADVALEVNSDGENNWTLGPTEPKPQTDPAGKGGVSAGIDQARLVNARLSFRDEVNETTYVLDRLNMTASIAALDQPLKLKADGRINTLPFEISLDAENIEAVLAGTLSAVDFSGELPFGGLSFDGNVALGDAPRVDGAFELSKLDVNGGLTTFGIADPMAPVIGTVSAKGNVSGPLDNLAIALTSLEQSGQGISAAASGKVTIGPQVTVEAMSISADVSDLTPLNNALKLGLADPKALGRIRLSADASGPVTALKIRGLKLEQSANNLTSSINGGLTLAGTPVLDLVVDARSGDLGALLQSLTGADAPIAAKTFSLQAPLSGPIDSISLPTLTAKLDDSTLTGNLQLSLAGARPSVTGALVIDMLDLDRLLPKSGNSGTTSAGPMNWSTDPLPLDGLRAADANVTLKVAQFRSGPLSARDIGGRAILSGGRLDLSDLTASLFGGKVGGQLVLDGSGPIPSLSIGLTGQTIDVASVTQTFAGLAPVTGTGAVSVELTSSGASVADIMQALTGQSVINLNDGAIVGLNLGQLVRSAQQALTTGQLPTALSPQEATDFTSLEGAFSIADGVASLGNFNLQSPYLRVTGNGQIDLGAQTLDLRLFPRGVASGQGQGGDNGLAGYGIPLRLSGAWTAPKPSLDTDWIRAKATELALDKAKGAIAPDLQERLPSGINGIVSDQLGLPSTGEEGEEQKTVEEQLEDAAKKGLTDLLTRPRRTEEPAEQPVEAEPQE